MPSGEVRQFLSDCRASIGVVGNGEHENIKWEKQGEIAGEGADPGFVEWL